MNVDKPIVEDLVVYYLEIVKEPRAITEPKASFYDSLALEMVFRIAGVSWLYLS